MKYLLLVLMCCLPDVANAQLFGRRSTGSQWQRTADGFVMNGKHYRKGFDDYCCGRASCVMQQELWEAKRNVNTQVALMQVANIEPAVQTFIPVEVVQSFVPTPPKYVDTMLSLAGVGPGDIVYDPGCGDGRILVEASKLGAMAVGIEINSETIKKARHNVSNHKGIRLVEGDATKYSFTGATVVTMYLYPETIKQLIPKLLDTKPGTRVVSYSQDIEGLPTTKHVVDGEPFYVWVNGHIWQNYKIKELK